MNDEQFEQVLAMLVRKGFDSTAEQLRTRDTAQREAVEAWKAAHAREATALAQAWEQRDAAQAQLAQLQAEMPDLRANMTKALDLLQVLTSTKYTDRIFVEAVDEADEMLEQLRGKVVLKGLADQQEAQEVGPLKGEFAEAAEQAFREQYGLQEAQGEPVAWQWRSRIKGGAWDAWENGRYKFEPAPFMDVEHRALYAAPPAAAHGDEAVRKDAERYRWLRNPGQDVALVLDKKTGHVPVDERGFGGYGIYEYRAGTELDEAIDAAMRAQGDGSADHA